MKRKINIFIIALLAISSCTFNSFGQNNNSDPKEILTIDQALDNLSSLSGKRIRVEGKCSHVCQESGKKLFMISNDGKKTLRFNASPSIGTFDDNAKDKIVRVSGTVKETRMTEEDINNLEQKLKAVAAKEAPKAQNNHCGSEAKANGENPANSGLERVKALREKLNKRIAEEKINYLSFYAVENSDEVVIVTK